STEPGFFRALLHLRDFTREPGSFLRSTLLGGLLLCTFTRKLLKPFALRLFFGQTACSFLFLLFTTCFLCSPPRLFFFGPFPRCLFFCALPRRFFFCLSPGRLFCALPRFISAQLRLLKFPR